MRGEVELQMDRMRSRSAGHLLESDDPSRILRALHGQGLAAFKSTSANPERPRTADNERVAGWKLETHVARPATESQSAVGQLIIIGWSDNTGSIRTFFLNLSS